MKSQDLKKRSLETLNLMCKLAKHRLSIVNFYDLVDGERQNTFITDGAPNFHDAFNKEFFTIHIPRTRHISHIRLQGDHNNNKMELLNGEVRDREKTMRGLKIQNSVSSIP
jgi:hypothetical protein